MRKACHGGGSEGRDMKRRRAVSRTSEAIVGLFRKIRKAKGQCVFCERGFFFSLF